MGSIRRSTRRLARLRDTNINPAVDSDFTRSTTALSIVCPWLLCMVSAQDLVPVFKFQEPRGSGVDEALVVWSLGGE